jgi:hypothetical protein
LSDEFKGFDQLAQAFARIERTLHEGRALYQEALAIQKVSMRRTPVDTGALRASHETLEPFFDGGEVRVAIAVGGPAAPYALVVHEDLDAHHNVGEAKFLEKSVLEAAQNLSERLGARIARNIAEAAAP